MKPLDRNCPPLATPSRILILASASPRRKALLEETGCRFKVIPATQVDERFDPGRESAEAYVQRLAQEKAREIVETRQAEIPGPAVVIGCDTVAVCEGEVLGKPQDLADARRMLEKLSGRTHRVLSGLCAWPLPESVPITRLAVTTLRMDPLTPEQLSEYLASGQWSGKAGAFGYQDRTGWLHLESGTESNVVGLPLDLLQEMLATLK